MNSWKLKNSVRAVLVGVALVATSISMAADSGDIDFNIEKQPIEAALKIFANQSGMQIMFGSEVHKTHKRVLLKGKYSRLQALDLLLKGTDLVYVFDGDNSVAIRSAEAPRTSISSHVATDESATPAMQVRDNAEYKEMRIVQADEAERTASGAVASETPNSGQPVDGLEEVIVTARRREESLQEVPVAVTALSQQVLQENNIQSVFDLQRYVPSLTVYSPSRESPLISIRGQGGYSPGSGPGVVSYLNEVPISIAGTGLYYDLQNVQVLKGPQGTLFGRNTTGGAVLFESKRPTNDFEGHIEAAAGNYRNREIDLAVNLPIVSDKLLMRVAGHGQKRDGFTKSLGTPNHPNGLDLDDSNVWGNRVSITFRPFDRVQNDLIYSKVKVSTHGTSGVLSYVNPANFANLFFPDLQNVFAHQQALGIRKQVATSVEPFTHVDYWGITDILRIDVTDNLTFRNIFGFSKTETSGTYDGDGTIFPIFDSRAEQPTPTRVKQYTEEPQLQGKSFDGNLTWVVGAFFLDNPAPSFGMDILRILGGTIVLQNRVGEKSKAGYAQGTYDLSQWMQGLKLTMGARYTWDERFAQVLGLNTIDTKKFSAPTWTVGLDYQLLPGTLLYATSRRGYRTGGFNTNSVLPGNQSFEPEFVNDIEIGLKSDWRIGQMRARTNFAVYHQSYTDIQLSQTIQEDPDNNSPPIGITNNIADANLDGAEFEGWFFPTENLEIGTQFTWLNFKFTNFKKGATRTDVTSSFQEPNQPKFKYGANVRYRLPLDRSLGNISLAAGWNWQAATYISVTPDPLAEQRAYGLLNLSASWDKIFGGPIDVSFFMNNATDKKYAIGGFPISNFVATSTLGYGEPRMWGARLRYRFGVEK